MLRARVRSALAGSTGWEEFADRLRCSGVLVRERYSTRNPGEITGYAVALLPHGTTDQASVWFGGGKLAPDLSLPQLQARWQDASAAGTAFEAEPASAPVGRSGSSTGGPSRDGNLTELERRRLWLSAQRAVREATDQIGAASSPHASQAQRASAQAAATAASEMLHAVSSLVERKHRGPLRAAGDCYDRAARDLHRRLTPTTALSRTTRHAAGALLSTRIVKRADTRQLLALISELTALCQTVALLRETQGRAAQARAARQAAEHLAAEQGRRMTAASAAVPVAASTRATRSPAVGVPPPPYVPTSAQTRRPSPSR